MTSILRQFGCTLLLGDADEAVENGVLAEEYGFDHVRIHDHTLYVSVNFVCPCAWTILSALGAKTSRVILSGHVHDPFRKHPLDLAQSVATLDIITKGRTALGIGAGEIMNLAPFGIEWEKPLTRLREAIITVRKLWKATPEKPADFNGEIFKLRKAFLQISPIQKPYPPIYVGALGPMNRRLTGELGDGWLPWIEAPETLEEHLKDVKLGAEKVGRDVAEIDVVAGFFTAISEDYETAFETVERPAKEALVLERSVSEGLGHKISIPKNFSGQLIKANKKYPEILNNAISEIPRKLVEKTTVIGDPDNCIGKIEEYLKAGATSVTIYNLGPNVGRTIELYGKKIIPYIKEQYG